jgi:UDP-glucose 4-epimerase
MRVVVTGGAGAIGNNLVRALLPIAEHVTVVDDLTSGMDWTLPEADSLDHIRGSILDEKVLRSAFAQPVTHVFHLAAFFANQNSVDHPHDDLQTNIVGTLKVLEASRDAEVKRFVYSSSSCVYGKKQGAIDETSAYDLETPYAISKLSAEFYVRYFYDHYGLPAVTLRYFNSYGPGEPPGRYRNVVPNFISHAVHGRPLPILGTGAETRDFTFVGDTVQGTLRAAQTEGCEGETFNLGTGRQTTISDLANLINAYFDNPGGIEYKEPRSWDHIKHRQADVSKARSMIGYNPSTTLEEGLQITSKWYDEHRKELDFPSS